MGVVWKKRNCAFVFHTWVWFKMIQKLPSWKPMWSVSSDCFSCRHALPVFSIGAPVQRSCNRPPFLVRTALAMSESKRRQVAEKLCTASLHFFLCIQSVQGIPIFGLFGWMSFERTIWYILLYYISPCSCSWRTWRMRRSALVVSWVQLCPMLRIHASGDRRAFSVRVLKKCKLERTTLCHYSACLWFTENCIFVQRHALDVLLAETMCSHISYVQMHVFIFNICSSSHQCCNLSQ